MGIFASAVGASAAALEAPSQSTAPPASLGPASTLRVGKREGANSSEPIGPIRRADSHRTRPADTSSMGRNASRSPPSPPPVSDEGPHRSDVGPLPCNWSDQYLRADCIEIEELGRHAVNLAVRRNFVH